MTRYLVPFCFALALICHSSCLAQDWEPHCRTQLENLKSQLDEHYRDHSGRYPETLEKLSKSSHAARPQCPASKRDYHYSVSADCRSFGLCCEGDHHSFENYPAVSSSSVVRQYPNGVDYSQCQTNLAMLYRLSESYRQEYGRFPSTLAYLADKPRVSLPSCDPGIGLRAPNETDYRIMLLGLDSCHILCTSVNHIGEGFAPLQPSIIEGFPAKAIFLLNQ